MWTVPVGSIYPREGNLAGTAKAIPAGPHTITPHLVVKGGSDAIAFYKKAFGAEELCRMEGPDGGLFHAALQIGSSRLFLVDEFPEYGAVGPNGSSPVTIHLYVADADAAFDQAVEAGATVLAPLANMPWGDRYGKLRDPFGHNWSIATHLEDVTPEQIRERMAASVSEAPCP